MAPPNPQPTWQPISQLPTIAWAINGMADEAVDMLGSLREARPKPHVLDDATVDRVIRLYAEQRDDLWLYEEQLRRWQAGKLTASQRREVTGLSLRLVRLRADIAEILELAAYLKPRTIDAVLARSDKELARDILSGDRPPPWSTPPSNAPAPEADEEDEPYDEEDFFAEGERLTPIMRALLQITGCLISLEPIPLALLFAPLAPHAAPGGPVALASLLQQGWLTAPTLATVEPTPKGRAFLAAHPSEEPARRTVIRSLCGLMGQLLHERDEATMRLVEPHLCELADAWTPRGDDLALMLNMAAASYHTKFGDVHRARRYLDRARALDAALNPPS